MVSALIMSGCNTNTPAPTTTSTDQPSTQAHQETTATIAVVDEDKNMMEMEPELTAEEAAKYQADLPLTERKELAVDLAMKMPAMGMDEMMIMFPDLEKVKDVPGNDAANMMAMGAESWMYSAEGDMTVVVCNVAKTPIHVFEGQNPTATDVAEAKMEMKAMMDSMHSDDSMMKDDTPEETAPAMEAGEPVYQEYTDARKTDLHGSKPYVLFFHANWCPICRVMETSITEGLASFPEGTTILKANYDTEKALKDEFGVRVQSTIIVLDADGEVVWKGQDPALDDLKQYITDSLS